MAVNMDVIVNFDAPKVQQWVSSSTIIEQGSKLSSKSFKKARNNGLQVDRSIHSQVYQEMDYADRMNKYINPDAKEDHEAKSWICLVDRTLKIDAQIPTDLEQFLSIFYESTHYTNDNEYLVDFATNYISVSLSDLESPLLILKNKPSPHMKKSYQLFTINLNHFPFTNIYYELEIFKLKNDQLKIEYPKIRLQVLQMSPQVVNITIDYKISILESLFYILPPHLVNGIYGVLALNTIDDPDSKTPFFDINPSEDPTTHLFYKTITEKTKSMEPKDYDIDIPGLNTKLHRFQRKSVCWLLENEGIIYDPYHKKFTSKFLFSSQYIESFNLLKNGQLPSDLLSQFDLETREILNKIKYGWHLIQISNKSYWYNKYTGNIGSRIFIVQSLLNTYNQTFKLPGKGLLSEEMGLGKTVEVLSLILQNPRTQMDIGEPVQYNWKSLNFSKIIYQTGTTLIIAPDSILQQWVNEVEKFAPQLSIHVYEGIKKSSNYFNGIAPLVANFLRGFDVVFTTYRVIAQELDFALYSANRKPTRNATKKRKFEQLEDSGDTSEEVELYKKLFRTNFKIKRADCNSLKEYSLKLIQEIEQFVGFDKKSQTKYYKYDSPLMFLQFWRVMLDEVQTVSSTFTRAFQTASLIPTYHAWGVSGTPVDRKFKDLHSVLMFLKIHPFSDEHLGNGSWYKLVSTNDNSDFVRLWSSLGLRHTKDMVSEDIKLPHQMRVMMTIPFNQVEQANYDEILTDCLTSVGLKTDGSPIFDNWKLHPTYITEMRTTLARLRKICCNPQLENFKILKGVKTQQPLMTLENVLDLMLEAAYDEVIESEKEISQLYIDAAEYYEFLLYPEEALKLLQVGVVYTEKIVQRLNQQINETIKQCQARVGKKCNDFTDYVNFEDTEINIEKDEKDEKDEQLSKLKTRLKSLRAKSRTWYFILHKYFFMIASCHFQSYDEEYVSKIQNHRKNSVGNSHLESMKKPGHLKDEVSHTFFGINTDIPSEFDPMKQQLKLETESESEVQSKILNHKFYEKMYYTYAEKIRSKLLRESIKAVEQAIYERITSKKLYHTVPIIDSGELKISKSTKKFFKYLPLIDIDIYLQSLDGISNELTFMRLAILLEELNRQSNLINSWMDEIMVLLCKPIVTNETSDTDPDGAEYSESIEDQDKINTYLILCQSLLDDRIKGIAKSDESVITKFQKNESTKHSIEGIKDSIFAQELIQKLEQSKLTSSHSLTNVIDDLSDFKFDTLSIVNKEKISLIDKLVEHLKNILNNQKNSISLIQGDLSNYNIVYNTKIEYFKQLQQISDSVDSQFANRNLEKENKNLVEDMMSKFMSKDRALTTKLFKAISKYRYLETLIIAKPEGEIQDECIICQSIISLGCLTRCGHKFCKACLQLWLMKSSSCPMCKTYVDESSIFNFTQNKMDLKANPEIKKEEGKIEDLSSSQSKDEGHLHSIYKNLDYDTLKEIQKIKLEASYSSKVDMIVKQVLFLKRKDPNVQIVVYSQFQALLYILGTAFSKEKIKYVTSNGAYGSQTRNSTANVKNHIELFKNPLEGITCFLLYSKTQAAGLTLTNASHIFLCEPVVNTATELQAISRIHRIGQTKPTTVWLFAIENTVEENMVIISTERRLAYFEKKLDATIDQSQLDKAESMTLITNNDNNANISHNDLWRSFFASNKNPNSEVLAHFVSLDE